MLRYDYSKVIHIDEKSADIDPGVRDFSFDAILIIEIKNRTNNGIFAVMHFDSPHVVMPENYLFLATADDPALQKDKMKAIVNAMQGAIKLARWNVILDGTGVMHIESRLPKTLDEWLHETEKTAFWRPKFRKLWVELIDKTLGLEASGDDRDLFLALTRAPESFGIDADMIRTFRSAAHVESNIGGKVKFSFTRQAPSKAGQPYKIPGIDKPNVVMTLNPILKGPANESYPEGSAMQVGAAVFDTHVGMLDTLNEEYSFAAQYSCAADASHTYTLDQRVTVKYNLKRLAPPIMEPAEPAVEAPIKAK